jgi:N-acetylglucosaminyldiphosphoundecaprenol N-acetyl-beta-D-mannosaminyltransferase
MSVDEIHERELDSHVEAPVDHADVASSSALREFRICDVKLHAIQVEDIAPIVRQWMKGKRVFHYVSSTNVNNVEIALESPEYYDVMERADLSLPDGVPFLWYGRMKGHSLRRRCGIEEFMEAVFDMSNRGFTYSHFFYGNTPQVLANLRTRLLERYPNLDIAGMYSPPFRRLSPEEDEEHVRIINDSGADFVWVSLGCPKQEKWLYDHRHRLTAVAGGGAGAVFNFFSGETFKAPDWVRYMGLEWILRLLMEPKRLFHRYCIKYPIFMFRFLKYSMGFKRARHPVSSLSPILVALFSMSTVNEFLDWIIDWF